MNPADAGHDVVVKCGLTADQYVWLRDRAEALGLSQSAYLRLLLQADRRAHARGHLGAAEHPVESAGPGPERAE
jgi:hypothetical protein